MRKEAEMPVTRVPSDRAWRRPLSWKGVALFDEAFDDSLASLKAERDAIVAVLKRRLDDPGKAGVPHEVFIRNRPRLP